MLVVDGDVLIDELETDVVVGVGQPKWDCDVRDDSGVQDAGRGESASSGQ